MKLYNSCASTLLLLSVRSYAAETSLRSRNLQKGGNEAGGPKFLEDDDLPPGLIDNPSKVLGVEFLPGRRPKAQKLPKVAKGRPKKIRGLDNKEIVLDMSKAEPINVYSPNKYELSEDGKFVTHIETGEIIPLTAFYLDDEENENDIIFAMDEDESIFHTRVTQKNKGKEITPKNKGQEKKLVKMQIFQQLVDTDILVGYYSDDVDLSKLPPLGEMMEDKESASPEDINPEEDPTNSGGRSRSRRLQSSGRSGTAYGKTCSDWDYVDIFLVTDRLFRNRYSSHQSHAQAIFAEAQEIYWKESCVWLYIEAYENTAVNNWRWESYPSWYQYSGCNGNGALDLLAWEGRYYKNNPDRDAMHMFTGSNFRDGNVIGCAYNNVCRSMTRGYGVNHMTYTNDLRLQAVLFAHELGHNLGLNHLSTTYGYWVMEPSINYAPWDLTNTNANYIRNKLLGSTSCGYY